MLHASFEPFRKLMGTHPDLLDRSSFQHDGEPILRLHNPTPRQKIHNFAVELVRFKNGLERLNIGLQMEFRHGWFYGYKNIGQKTGKHSSVELTSNQFDRAMNHLPEDALSDKMMDHWDAIGNSFEKIHQEYRKHQIYKHEPTKKEKLETERAVSEQLSEIGKRAGQVLDEVAKQARKMKENP